MTVWLVWIGAAATCLTVGVVALLRGWPDAIGWVLVALGAVIVGALLPRHP